MASDMKPIRSEAAYEAALAEVARLWGAKSGTPKGDRLDVLATLIDAYETEHVKMDPPASDELRRLVDESLNGPGPNIPAAEVFKNLRARHAKKSGGRD